RRGPLQARGGGWRESDRGKFAVREGASCRRPGTKPQRSCVSAHACASWHIVPPAREAVGARVRPRLVSGLRCGWKGGTATKPILATRRLGRESWRIEGPVRLEGALQLAGDKSIAHRAVLLAALSRGACRLRR